MALYLPLFAKAHNYNRLHRKNSDTCPHVFFTCLRLLLVGRGGGPGPAHGRGRGFRPPGNSPEAGEGRQANTSLNIGIPNTTFV